MKIIKKETFQTHLQGLTAAADNDYSLWKAIKRLKQLTQRIPPIRSADHTSVRSDKEKASTFAGQLVKAFKPNELQQNANFETEINKTLKEPLQITQPINFLTQKEIQNTIQEISTQGYDLISGRILQELPRKGIVHLTSITNSIIRTGYSPAQWRFAQIMMIPKPSKPLEEVPHVDRSAY
jgi:hypothetical protein